WGGVAGKHLVEDLAVEAHEADLLAKLQAFHDDPKKEPVLKTDTDKEAYSALRYEHFGDLFNGPGDTATAKTLYLRIRDESGNTAEPLFWGLYAARRLNELSGGQKPEERKKVVARALEACKELPDDQQAKAHAIARDIVDLYGDDLDLKATVNEARQILKQTGK
ncbi:MAG TPA: hypothetical protein VMS17_21330, partial [Gemmataceae bacterium]|nr:hypothetical protein [Gemmataceae bacterium]